MKEYILKAIAQVQDSANDVFNPETYFDNRVNGVDGVLHNRYLLGNYYGYGYSEENNVNFEIFKDHSTWQIWIWKFGEEKNVNQNNFSAPYHAYDKLVEFIEKEF